ncbi:MAG TPA: hypothetical protein VFS21_37470 [Roseiflexaceae bacterium]|nr:hypothetical protein [Roseiflexaceae bacterium]
MRVADRDEEGFGALRVFDRARFSVQLIISTVQLYKKLCLLDPRSLPD